jgi:hypothetical protein
LDRDSPSVTAPDSALPSAQVQRERPRTLYVPYVEVSISALNGLRLRHVASSFLASLGKISD